MVSLLIGALADQKIMLYLYDPVVLEENAITLAGVSYLSGCIGYKGPKAAPKDKHKTYEECVNESRAYKTEVSEIFHDKIWEHPKRRQK